MSIKEKIKRIEQVAELLEGDDPDKQELLNTEGDYSDLMEWALRKYNEYCANADSCDELKKLYDKRRKSFTKKADNMRNIAEWILNSANEKKYLGVAGTVSVRDIPPKPMVLDESKLPKEYIKIKESVDKAKINADIKGGKTIPGVGMSNGSKTIMMRS